jgi:hypothetical protein
MLVGKSAARSRTVTLCISHLPVITFDLITLFASDPVIQNCHDEQSDIKGLETVLFMAHNIAGSPKEAT